MEQQETKEKTNPSIGKQVASTKALERKEVVSYLIGACDARSIEHGKKEFRCEEDHKRIRNDEQEEGCPKAVDFSRSPEDSDS